MEFHYLCSACNATYDFTPSVMLCPKCESTYESGKPLKGVLKVVVEGQVSRHWSPGDLLPIEHKYFPPIPVGNTPIWHPQIGLTLGFQHLYIKDDTRNPTGSLKDRASYLVSAFARKYNMRRIALASTGNAGSSMAGVGAAAGQEVILFLPAAVPRAKLVQAMQYGAKVVLVEGNYDKAYQLCMAYCKEESVFNRNTGFNPLTIEGKKTVSLELVRQLRRAPDCVFVPTGDGVILSGVYKGFEDLLLMGVIEQIPKIYAVQAKGSNAIMRAFRSGEFECVLSSTRADSLSVDVPSNGYQALAYLQKYKGEVIEVSDEEILSAQYQMSSGPGLFVEPAAAAAFAAFIRERRLLDQQSTIVILVTGTGLKDIDSAYLSLQNTKVAATALSDF